MATNSLMLQKPPMGNPITFYLKENAKIPTPESILFT
jgi:hypothetical protein